MTAAPTWQQRVELAVGKVEMRTLEVGMRMAAGLSPRRIAVGALDLAVLERRRPGVPVVLIHGFGGDKETWLLMAPRLRGCPLVLLDLPGHGASGHDSADLDESGRLIGAVGGAGVYVGYSMGGRMALHLSLAQPELVRALVLIGATAGIEDETERGARRLADETLAEALTDQGLERFLDEWLAGPLFASLSPGQAARQQRLVNRVEGLAASLRTVGTGSQRSLWSELARLDMPVLAMAGLADTKFSEIARRLAKAVGVNAEVAVLPGGHAVHLESPVAAADRVRQLVTRVSNNSPS